MAKFPNTEAEVDQLAALMIGGFAEQVDKLPSPPVATSQLESSLEAYRDARIKAMDAAAAAKQATAEKNEALKRLIGDMKMNLRYAENTCRNDKAALQTLGWGIRRPKTPMDMPGQVESFRIVKEGPGWIEFKWKKPSEGGEVRVYRIERCKLGHHDWHLAEISTAPRVRLEKQERGVHWMYRAIAVNAVGEGSASALAEAVL